MHVFLLAALLSLPPYESVKGIDRYATAAEYASAASDNAFELSKIAYDSDGLHVFAYTYAPKKSATKLPVIVFNRGSYIRDEFAPELIAMFHRLAKAGFIVVAPALRGSAGSEGRDEMGGADVDDVMNLQTVIHSLPNADAENIFMYGESRGGMMTLQAIREHFPLRAAATFGAFTDLASFLGGSAQSQKAAASIWPDYAEHSAAIAERRSAIAWADRITVPLLIIHGGHDRDVSPSQSLGLAEKLQAAGKEYELIVHAGSNHVLTDWRAERDAAAIDWFRRHLK